METRPDIGKMIEEELAKGGPEAAGEKPLTPENLAETAEAARLEQEVDQAFENIQGKEDEATAKVDSLAVTEATRAMKALREGDRATLASLKADFLKKARETAPDLDEAAAMAMLGETLRQYHDAYRELGKPEFAAEIDSLRRSLETSAEVTTDAGKDYLRRLNAGEFPTLESAITAFEE